jgi:hypothetical protein
MKGNLCFTCFFINLCHFITQRFCCIFEYFLLKNVTSGPRSFLGPSTCFRLPVLITMHINYKNPKVKVTKINFPIFSKSRLFVRNWQKWCYILAWRARIPESVFTIRLFLMKKNICFLCMF